MAENRVRAPPLTAPHSPDADALPSADALPTAYGRSVAAFAGGVARLRSQGCARKTCAQARATGGFKGSRGLAENETFTTTCDNPGDPPESSPVVRGASRLVCGWDSVTGTRTKALFVLLVSSCGYLRRRERYAPLFLFFFPYLCLKCILV